MSIHQFPSSGAVPGSVCLDRPPGPRPAPDLRPLYITEEQLALIEGWASNAATHGNLEAWGVLSQALLWRVSS